MPQIKEIFYTKKNLNHCPSIAQWKEDKKGGFSFRCERKTPENYSKENPQSVYLGTENPIHMVPPA